MRVLAVRRNGEDNHMEYKMANGLIVEHDEAVEMVENVEEIEESLLDMNLSLNQSIETNHTKHRDNLIRLPNI